MRDPVGSIPLTYFLRVSFRLVFHVRAVCPPRFRLFSVLSCVYFFFCYWTIHLSCPSLMFDVSNSLPGRKCGTLQCLWRHSFATAFYEFWWCLLGCHLYITIYTLHRLAGWPALSLPFSISWPFSFLFSILSVLFPSLEHLPFWISICPCNAAETSSHVI